MISFNRQWAVPLMALALPMFLSCPVQAYEKCEFPDTENSAIGQLCSVQDGMAEFEFRNSWGFLNKEGQVAIAPQFAEVTAFAEERAGVKQKGKWGFIDKAGKWIATPAYSDIDSFSEGLVAVELNNKWGYLDRTGHLAIEPIYASAGPFRGGSAVVSEKLRDRYLMIDRQGQVIKRFAADLRVNEYPNAFGLFKVKQQSAPVILFPGGPKIPVPEAVYGAPTLQEGVLLATQTVLRGDREVQLWGTVTPDGQWVTPAQFESLSKFHYGLAVASSADALDGAARSVGLVDRQGRFLVPPKYSDMTRDDRGWYRAQRPGQEGVEFFDARGSALLSSSCGKVQELDLIASKPRPWAVFTGCGETWVLHASVGLIKSRIAHPDASASSDHLLLLGQEEPDRADDATDDAVTGKPRQFEIFNADGMLVFSNDDAQMQGENALRGQYVSVSLLDSSGPLGRQNPQRLPVALISNDHKDLRVLTRNYQVVSGFDGGRSLASNYRYVRENEPIEGPLPLKSESGWGAIDGQGQWVVKPIYESLSSFRNGIAYAATGEKEWMVDSNGQRYDLPAGIGRLQHVAPGVLLGFDEKESDQVVRLEPQKGSVTRFKMPDDLRLDAFYNGLAAAKEGELWGLINDFGEWILPPKFTDTIEPVLKGQQLIGWKSGRYYKGERYRESLHGWVDPQGKELLGPRYVDIRYDDKADALFVNEDDQSQGVMALDGKLLIEPGYQQVTFIGEGRYVVEPRELTGLISSTGEWAAPLSRYHLSDLDKQPFKEEWLGEKQVLVDIAGRISSADVPLSLPQDRPEWWWSQGRYDDQGNQMTVFYGYDFKERARVPGDVSYHRFSEDVVVFRASDSSGGELLGLADAKGKVLGRYPYKRIEPMQQGLAMYEQQVAAPARGRAAVQGLNGEEVTRIGYLNRAGKLAIAPRFEAGQSFSEGRAVVVSRGNLGLIDSTGRLIMQGAWQCGRNPVILGADGAIVWPEAASKKKKC